MNTQDRERRDRIERIREIMSKKKFKVRKDATWKEPKPQTRKVKRESYGSEDY